MAESADAPVDQRGRKPSTIGRFRLFHSQRQKFAFCFASIVSQLGLLRSCHCMLKAFVAALFELTRTEGPEAAHLLSGAPSMFRTAGGIFAM